MGQLVVRRGEGKALRCSDRGLTGELSASGRWSGVKTEGLLMG